MKGNDFKDIKSKRPQKVLQTPLQNALTSAGKSSPVKCKKK